MCRVSTIIIIRTSPTYLQAVNKLKACVLMLNDTHLVRFEAHALDIVHYGEAYQINIFKDIFFRHGTHSMSKRITLINYGSFNPRKGINQYRMLAISLFQDN